MQSCQRSGDDSQCLVSSGGGRAVEDKRTRIGDRRQKMDMPGVPFKDTKGVMVKQCRRKTPDRRAGSIHLEWISDYETW
jgi:hypothetical protein